MNKKLHIPIMKLDAAWCLRGFNHYDYAKEYCNYVLKIPLNSIEKSTILPSGIEVELKNVEKIAQEEWYIVLSRIAEDKKDF